MLDRKREAELAWDVAEAMERNADDPEKLKECVKKWRQDGLLAVSPTATLSVRQHYADLLAEYACAKAFFGTVTAQDLEGLDKTELEKFRAIFPEKPEGEEADYAKYAQPVLELHRQIKAFYRALNAYATLRPGKKGGEDSDPTPSAVRKAADREVTVKCTFDVYSNQISSVDRYCRALWRQSPKDAPKEGWRIPVALCEKADAQTVALAALLYYRHKADMENVKRKYSDYYPMELAATGIYLTEKNQQEAVSNLLEKQLPKKTGKKAANPEEEDQKDDIPEKANRCLRFREVYFRNGNRERRVMAALSKEAVDLFVRVNKEDAPEDTYRSISESNGEAFDPRAVLNGIAGIAVKDAKRKNDGLLSFLRNGTEVDVNALVQELRDEWNRAFQDVPSKDVTAFQNRSATALLRMAAFADFLALSPEEQECAGTKDDREITLTRAEKFIRNPQACDGARNFARNGKGWKYSLKREKTDDGFVFRYRVYQSQK